LELGTAHYWVPRLARCLELETLMGIHWAIVTEVRWGDSTARCLVHRLVFGLEIGMAPCWVHNLAHYLGSEMLMGTHSAMLTEIRSGDSMAAGLERW
jgi:hypothetical protein